MTLSRAFLVAVSAFALGGCTLLRQFLSAAFVPPTLTLQAAQVAEVTLDGATLDVVYTLENPNPLAIELEEVDYALEIEGKPFASGKPERGLRIPADGRATLTFPAKIRFADLFGIGTALQGKDSAKFTARGSVAIASPTGMLRLPLQADGEIAVPKAPEVSLGLPTLSNLSLTSATIEVPLEVKNGNPFALNFGFNGALAVAGAKVASVAENTTGTVPAKASSKLSIPLTIQFADAIGAASAAAAGSAPLTFNGALESGSVRIPVKWAQLLPFAKLNFASASVSDVTFEGAKVNLTFDADNPTDLPVELANVQYALFIDGKQAAQVPTTAGPKLSAKSKSQVTFPVEFKFADVTAALASLFSKETSSYRAEGSFTLPTPIGPMQIPIKTEGKFELPRLPQVKIKSPKIANLGFTSATIEVPLELSNPNAFALPLNGLDAAVSIAGARIGSMSFGDLGELAPGGSRQVAAPLTFELLKFMGAATALRTGNATVALDGSLQSGKIAVPLKISETVRFTR